SISNEGQTARRRIEEARESVGLAIGGTAREIVFTSGGTESNNAAIFGAVAEGDRNHIVTTAIEHPSVLEPAGELERRGHAVTVVAPSRSGEVPASAVIDALRHDTRLVTMMLANNETGVVQPVAEVANACRERGIHLHCDAVQPAGKIDADGRARGADTLALSAHQRPAPKGVAALYVWRGRGVRRRIGPGRRPRVGGRRVLVGARRAESRPAGDGPHAGPGAQHCTFFAVSIH